VGLVSQARPERHYRLRHRTTSTYPEPVTSSYGRAVLLPRDGFGQVPRAATLEIRPGAADRSDYLDVAGNRMTYFHVTAPHTVLEVRAESVISVARRRVEVERVPQLAWEQVVAAVRQMRAGGHGPHGEGPATVLGIVDAALPSDLGDPGPEVLAYALPSFRSGAPLVAGLTDLAQRISRDYASPPADTAARSRLPEVIARRSGTGVDLAHLACACLRAMGLSARYVSGYREAAGDASHAWAAAWLPGAGWLHVDPAAGQFVDDRYVVLGWGRDHGDVAPLRGVSLSRTRGSTLAVEVTLTPVSEAEALAVAADQREAVPAGEAPGGTGRE
jgi:transglutaminase-like putative cysteine protease